MDADVTADAQNAPKVTWKTADSFPQAPTPIIFLGGRKKNGRATSKNSANQLSTKSDQVQIAFAQKKRALENDRGIPEL